MVFSPKYIHDIFGKFEIKSNINDLNNKNK